MKQVITVSQLNGYLRHSLEKDQTLQSILVQGEISNFTHHRSGHMYFTLKDAKARLACVMFASYASRCALTIENGMQVIASGSVALFEASGSVQLYVEALEQAGRGLLFQELEERKKKLLAEGLFAQERKKPLHPYPKRIAVISAKEGAAIQDVFTTLRRRWPIAHVSFLPCLVQGKDAEQAIVEALSYADSIGFDAILLVRGGGSIEDLWCFNSEAVARAVANCVSVVITGIGHESDTTLVDYVSDLRAPTPTAAAELAVPSRTEVLAALQKQKQRLQDVMRRRAMLCTQRYEHLANHPYLRQPRTLVRAKQQELLQARLRIDAILTQYENKKQRYYFVKQGFLYKQQWLQREHHRLSQHGIQLTQHIKQIKVSKRSQLMSLISLLEAYSPLALLKKGYVMTYQNEQVVRDMQALEDDVPLLIRYVDGQVVAKIIKKETL